MAITAGDIANAAEAWNLRDFIDPFLAPLAAYGNLLMRWNRRMSLTSIRDEAEVVSRHIMEGSFAALHHPAVATSLDFGSGTGVPGILIAICRPEIRVTLAESQRKKAAFLAEVIRELDLSAMVHAGRAEELPPASFDAVWMRAVDKGATVLPVAATLVARAGSLCLFETAVSLRSPLLALWGAEEIPFPMSLSRVLHIYRRD